ncbi:hypothetical protein PRMUPPPA20_14580 [Xylanibacter ruminicola]|uniref:HaeIII restriction endonuclease n=2 Tax=Xylanibacter ruminicola TaxID=839 RepID=A0AA37MPB2_XYLRU|nr:HaeIII family restriction endonuclease [Xylanibacter ruminicola]ADE81763.1 prophage PRU01, putative type II restriction endonuclease [Xylanibacter ruminicola 23]GJG33349.1 hypothetical protein PRMUPPPA20_14580 [Xylanibacter ruminicola]SEI02006.1 HaeIII restriction endonuclease [Xylanibacter ruminicola]
MPKSDELGRAFEYICVKCLEEEISKIRSVVVANNNNLIQDMNNWNCLDENTKTIMKKEALAAIPTLRELEPMIEDNSGDILTIRLQSDKEGIIGDVRDILIIRDSVKWVIGISVKHNHLAVKHSRLSNVLDFGNSWLGMPCSKTYWDEIAPIFAPLIKNRGKIAWSALPNKESTVYVPLLKAFIKEINKDYEKDKTVPSRMVEYLLGKYDFYKLIGIDSSKMTQLMAFNLRGTLNHASKTKVPSRKIPISLLPTRIISFGLKPKSNNTAELYMDNGWQFSFRIHNASTLIEPSLKFDIQIIGMPTSIITINCMWA